MASQRRLDFDPLHDEESDRGRIRMHLNSLDMMARRLLLLLLL
jgi:hypothetical protein